MPLNDNQKKFIALYRATTPRNATRAYEQVYAARGHVAEQSASRLLRNVEIQTAIAEADAEDLRDLGITPAGVLRDVARLAFSDARQLFDDLGALKPLHLLDDDIAMAVSSVEVTETMVPGPDSEPVLQRTRKIRLWSKPQSQLLLAKHLKLISDKVELGADTLAALARMLDRLPETALHALVTPNGTAAALPHRER